MKLEQSFEVSAPLERVWAALIDVERVAPCLPGAEVTGRNDDGSYNGTFKVKIGPTAAAYSGKLHMDDVDESAHKAVMHAQGTDRRGQGGAKATIESSVAEAGPGSTRVDVVTDYHITGRLARFGRGGMIEEISNRLLTEFAKSLQAMVAADGGAGEAAAPPAPAAAAAVDTASAVVADPGPAEAAEASDAEPPTEVHTVPSDEPATVGADPGDESGEGAAAGPSSPAAAPVEAAEVAAAAGAAAEPAPAATSAQSAPPPPPRPPVENEPVNGLSLMGSVAWSQAKSNPAPILAVVIGFLVALRVFRRRDS